MAVVDYHRHMQTARIPMMILLALELAGTSACTTLGPCLSPPPPEDDANLGPCLEVVEEPVLTPCLSKPPPADDPDLGPCLEVPPPQDPPIGPCLQVLPPGRDSELDEPRVGPCLRVAPPRDTRRDEPKATKPDPVEGATARADILKRLADSLPPDVLAKLRSREI